MSTALDDDPILKGIPLLEGWKVLPPVVLYAKIGQGGMGAVYRGWHLDLNIDVAVKCLRASLASEDDQFISRFRHEGTLSATLSHENLIRVYDSRKAHGLHYLVMEFVDGENARARVTRKGPLDEVEAATILLGAARGLAKAHRHPKTVVHRDVKPDNILISRHGEVKLADLGIAKALEGIEGATFNTEGVIGTPQFMAPEQWDRDQPLGPQADVWSFGATLYYLLTGESGIRSGTQKQIYVDVCQKPFPDVRRKRPEISAEMSAILSKCLQKDMNERYADAGELAKALEAFLGQRTSALDDPDTGTAPTIALVSPPPMPTMKRIRTQVEQGTGELPVPTPTPPPAAPTPPPPQQQTSLIPKSRKKSWWIGGGVTVLAAVIATAAWNWPRKPGEQREDALVDRTGPVITETSPLEGTNIESGRQTIKLIFDEPLSRAEAARQKASSIVGQVAEFALTTPVDGMWSIEYEVEDLHKNVTKGVVRYGISTKPVPKVPRFLLTSPTLNDDVVYIKDKHLILRGEIENPASDLPKVQLSVGKLTREYELQADGGIKIDFLEVPSNERSEVKLKCGSATREFVVVQDSTEPLIEFVTPARGVLRTNAVKIDIEVKVTDAYLRHVELDGRPMSQAGGIWRIPDVPLEQDRENIFDIVAADQAGNAPKVRARIVQDRTKPKLLEPRPPKGSEVLPGERVTITLPFNEDLKSALIDGQDVTPDGGTAQMQLRVPAGDGPWTVPFDVVDMAENHTTDSVSYVRKSRIAPPAPRITLLEPSVVDGLLYTSKETIALKARIENASEAVPTLLVDATKVNGAFKGGDWVADVKLSRDKRSKIELGYGTASPVVFEVIQDAKPPGISAVSPASFTQLTREKSIELVVRVDEPNLMSVVLGAREMKSDGKGGWRIDALELPRDGVFSHEVVATDRAGNQATQTFAITRDTVAAKLSRSDSEPKADASFAAGATLQARLEFDEAIAAVILGEREIAAVNRAVRFSMTVPDGSGPWALEGRVRDLAGNLGDFTLPLNRTLEAAPPDLKQPESTGPSEKVSGSSAPEDWKIIEPPSGSRWARKVEEPRTGIRFVLIAPGEFTMGSPNSEPKRLTEEKLHQVRITAPFYMAESETTQAQYRSLVSKSPSEFKGDQLPVECVSWTEAVAFCQLIGCELPTEAQWEFACRAATEGPFHYGKTITPLQANYRGSFVYPGGKSGVDRGKTIAVKGFPPNAWGLYDMHGNVWEWCRDVYDSEAYSRLNAVDPVFEGKGKSRVARGGSWGESPEACRSACRFKYAVSAKEDFIGFRCVKLLPADPK